MTTTNCSLEDRLRLNVPWVESPFFYELLSQKALSGNEQHTARFFHEHGYVILENVLETDAADKAIAELDPLYHQTGDSHSHSGPAIVDGWKAVEAPKALADNARILGALKLLFGRNPHPVHTLNFKHTNHQALHADNLRYGTFPGSFVAGVWIALESFTPDSGNLYFYPGSHRDRSILVSDLVEASQYDSLVAEYIKYKTLTPVSFTIPKGAAIIWGSRLLHGSHAPMNPRRTRHTQFTQYLFDDCLYYSPMGSNPITGEYVVRTDLIDIRTGTPLSPNYNGLPCSFESVGPRTMRIRVGKALPATRKAPPTLLDQLAIAFRRLTKSIHALLRPARKAQ